jgi:hypothetical protein
LPCFRPPSSRAVHATGRPPVAVEDLRVLGRLLDPAATSASRALCAGSNILDPSLHDDPSRSTGGRLPRCGAHSPESTIGFPTWVSVLSATGPPRRLAARFALCLALRGSAALRRS